MRIDADKEIAGIQAKDNQAELDDEITLSFAGSNRVAQIVDIDTKRGGQVYLFIILVRF